MTNKNTKTKNMKKKNMKQKNMRRRIGLSIKTGNEKQKEEKSEIYRKEKRNSKNG